MQGDTVVQYAVPRKGIPAAASLRAWADVARGQERGSLVIRIVDADESAALNLAYRGKSGPTNVLSFPFEIPADLPNDHLGDLVVCAPVVQQEASQQGKSDRSHWAHMVIHGVLHLRGYDHLDARQAREMEQLEVLMMASLGFADPYR